MQWKTADGKVLEISEMSDEHLDNALTFLENGSKRYSREMMTYEEAKAATAIKEEKKRREPQPTEKCPWCGTAMVMTTTPVIEVGWHDDIQQFVCPKCGAAGPTRKG